MSVINKIINLKLNDMNSGNRISVFCVLIILSTIIIFTSCVIKVDDNVEDKAFKEDFSELKSTTDNIEEKLYGTWEYKVSINETEFRNKLSNHSIDKSEGKITELALDGKLTIVKGKRYKNEQNVLFTMFINMLEEELAVKYRVEDIGSWKLAGNFIVYHNEEYKTTPINNIAKNMERQNISGDLSQSFGSISSYEILSIDEKAMVLKDDLTGIPITYYKK